MPAFLPAWLTSAADAIRRLADRPWTLFFVLLAFNAIARSCSITAHDARLYSLQALNQAEHGAYADDVFLRYGSQDQFTFFSRVVGPMVAALGLRLAFFVLYLVFSTLFIFALFRLVLALTDDALIATLALTYLVTAPLSYGGGDIFTVHEQFFTPRIITMTFTLFALERTLRQHFVQALLLLIAGALIHPLMAFGGIMIWVGCVAWVSLPKLLSGVAFLITAAIGIVILATPAIGTRLFGTMDDDWHQLIRTAVGYNYPDTWSVKDWINLGVSFALPIAACLTLYRDDSKRRQFYIVVTLSGAIGFLVTVAASMLPYALLFQGQPYRVLWILKVVQIPLGFLLIARWSQSSAIVPRLAALSLVAFFCVTHYITLEYTIFAIAVSISILVSRLSEQSWWYGAARGFVFGALGWMFYRWQFFIVQRELIAQFFDLNEWVLFDLVSPMFWLVGLYVAAHFWRAEPREGPVEDIGVPNGNRPLTGLGSPNYAAIRWSAIAVALLVPLALFATEVSPTFQRDHSRLGDDIAFVRDFVRERETPDGRRPSVYCPFGRADLLWIDVHATSYFSILQTAGVMFHRDTALEIDRRCGVVAKFEMARQREEMLVPDEAKKMAMANLFKIDFDSPAPTPADLVRLCQEPRLDYVVLPQEFPGLYSATNGRIFVYECYKVRAAAGLAFSARTASRER
jgi:hypothetical protein